MFHGKYAAKNQARDENRFSFSNSERIGNRF